MFCYKEIVHKRNKNHRRSSRLLLENYKHDCEDLLKSSGNTSICQRCTNSLLTKVYKYIHGLSPKIMNNVFSTRVHTYNTQKFNEKTLKKKLKKSATIFKKEIKF